MYYESRSYAPMNHRCDDKLFVCAEWSNSGLCHKTVGTPCLPQRPETVCLHRSPCTPLYSGQLITPVTTVVSHADHHTTRPFVKRPWPYRSLCVPNKLLRLSSGKELSLPSLDQSEGAVWLRGVIHVLPPYDIRFDPAPLTLVSAGSARQTDVPTY